MSVRHQTIESAVIPDYRSFVANVKQLPTSAGHPSSLRGYTGERKRGTSTQTNPCHVENLVIRDSHSPSPLDILSSAVDTRTGPPFLNAMPINGYKTPGCPVCEMYYTGNEICDRITDDEHARARDKLGGCPVCGDNMFLEPCDEGLHKYTELAREYIKHWKGLRAANEFSPKPKEVETVELGPTRRSVRKTRLLDISFEELPEIRKDARHCKVCHKIIKCHIPACWNDKLGVNKLYGLCIPCAKSRYGSQDGKTIRPNNDWYILNLGELQSIFKIDPRNHTVHPYDHCWKSGRSEMYLINKQKDFCCFSKTTPRV